MKIIETDLQKTQMLERSEDFKMLFINILRHNAKDVFKE